jgi:hypothetical protein
MKGIIRRLRPSPAMVVACIALSFAMTGAGYAAGMLGPNTVGTKQLKKNAVISSKVKNGSLLKADFKSGQIPAGPQGPAGAAGAAGPAGAQGIQGVPGPAGQNVLRYVRNGPVPIAANGYTFQTIACPAGMYPLGGGTYGNLIPDRVVVTIPWNTSSGTSGVPNAWGGGVQAGGSATSMTVFAICAPAQTATAGYGPDLAGLSESLTN